MVDFPRGFEHLVQEVEREQQEAARPLPVDPEIMRALELGVVAAQMLCAANVEPTHTLRKDLGWSLRNTASSQGYADDNDPDVHHGSFLSRRGSIFTYSSLHASQSSVSGLSVISYSTWQHVGRIRELNTASEVRHDDAYRNVGYIELQKDIVRLVIRNGIKLPGQK
ncbi:hypothetical protein BH09PAT4_BH09PAT4_03830 [soil metagenome]